MQSYTTTDTALIEAVSRSIQYTVMFADVAGGPIVASSFTVDRQVKDVPDQTNAFNGVAAAQATITIPESGAAALSPWVGGAQSAKPRSRVTVQCQFLPGGSVFTVFSGLVTKRQFGSTGDCTITALDDSASTGGTFTMPAGGATDGDGLGDWKLSPLSPIDIALRSGGVYLTPPPALSAADRKKYAVLAVSGCGGWTPEIGSIVSAYSGYTAVGLPVRVAGKFTPDIIAGPTAPIFQGLADPLAVRDHVAFQCDGWFRLVTGTSGVILDYGAVFAAVSASAVTVNDATGAGISCPPPAGVNLLDGQFHHLCVRTVVTNGLQTTTAWVDGRQTTVGTNQAAFPLNASSTPTRCNLGAPGLLGEKVAWEGFEAFLVPAGVTISLPGARFGQAAGTPSAITATTTRLTAIPPQSGADMWQTIQAIAQAEGAVAGFDETGTWRFEPKRTWMARRVTTEVRAITESREDGLPLTDSRDGLFGSVSANVQTVTVTNSTYSNPTWAAADVITVKGKSTLVQDIQSDGMLAIQNPFEFTALANMITGPGPNDTLNIYGAVQASRVGDPAAPQLGNLQITTLPKAGGFTLKIVNPNGFDVALWSNGLSPIPAGPCLIICGQRITVSDPRPLSAPSNPTVAAILAIDDNPWRQDPAATQALCETLAGDVYASIPTLDAVTMPGDPRLQLGDLITVQDSRLMTNPLKVLIVGITHSARPDSQFTTALQLRAIGAPKAWILGVPGLSELGSTTILPAA